MAALAAAVAIVGTAMPVAAQQQKELSEKSVQTLMNYAWTVLPAKFTTPANKTILVDKTKRDALVPLDVGREVIKVGYMSAQAQLCEMWEDQTVNYDAMMIRERDKKTWSDQQLLYITTLHRMTIHMAAGKLKVVEKGKDEVEVLLEPIEAAKDACPAERKAKIRETIHAYVKATPGINILQAPTEAPATTASVPQQPVPAAAKDQKK